MDTINQLDRAMLLCGWLDTIFKGYPIANTVYEIYLTIVGPEDRKIFLDWVQKWCLNLINHPPKLIGHEWNMLQIAIYKKFGKKEYYRDLMGLIDRACEIQKERKSSPRIIRRYPKKIKRMETIVELR